MLSGTAVPFAAEGRPAEFPGMLTVLWGLAGAAMAAVTMFLAVLVVAAIGLRLGPARLRRRPRLVFTASSAAVVAVTAAALLVTGLPGDPGRTGRPAGAPVALDQHRPAHVYPPLSGTPLTYARGGSSGTGLFPSRNRSLVLYGSHSPDQSGELSATSLVNLVSHFGAWTAHPVSRYRAGELTSYDAVFYLGEASGTPLPAPFLDDVLAGDRPVMWIGGDLDRLRERDPAAWRRYRFTVDGFDAGPFRHVRYKDAALPINELPDTGLARVTVADPATVTVLGTAERGDGTSTPWAVRSRDLLFVSEDPLPFVGDDDDRYLALADLLFEVLDRHAAPRHRALVRLEDVGPTADPVKLREVIDYLYGQHVPFSVGVYPVHQGPGGDARIRLSERPELVAALAYATSHGGSLVMHGYTHQSEKRINPIDGESGQDAEFYLSGLNSEQAIIPLGPVPGDSQAWALNRIDQGLAEFARAGLPRPSTYEFPHYMASPNGYLAAGRRFTRRYERALYFPGLLSGRPVVDSQRSWQLFPYAVRDVYGAVVVPENLDYVTSDGGSVPAMLAAARSNLVVRDGVASFFYHPFLGVGELPKVVDGIRALGYTFVSSEQLVTGR